MVILDAPPLLPVTDAAVLTANADGALVVISAGQTIDNELRTSLDHLEDVQGPRAGRHPQQDRAARQLLLLLLLRRLHRGRGRPAHRLAQVVRPQAGAARRGTRPTVARSASDTTGTVAVASKR